MKVLDLLIYIFLIHNIIVFLLISRDSCYIQLSFDVSYVFLAEITAEIVGNPHSISQLRDHPPSLTLKVLEMEPFRFSNNL